MSRRFHRKSNPSQCTNSIRANIATTAATVISARSGAGYLFMENQEALALHPAARAAPLLAPVYRVWGSSCMEFYAVSHPSPAKCRDIACRAGTFLSRRRPGPIGHGIASRQKLPRASLTLPARTNAPQSVGWLASSSRRRPSWPCWSPGFSQNPNPAPVIGLSKWTQHQTMKGNPQG